LVEELPTEASILFMDLEGAPLARYGSVSLIQILTIYPSDHAYIVNVYIISEASFAIVGSSGQTLRGILEIDNHR
jgi:hypothetical protein